MSRWLGVLALCSCAAVMANAQVAELSVSGGTSRFGGKALTTTGSGSSATPVTLTNGFRLAIRFTLNTYKFFGHEFGYSYNRSHIRVGGDSSTDTTMPIHQGFYDFLAYATPEGSKIRPFAAGGVQFSSFFPPGTSVYYGNQVTKFGFNYGGGIKIRLTPVWGVRFDFRQYNMSKPDLFLTPPSSGRLLQDEITGGISFNL